MNVERLLPLPSHSSSSSALASTLFRAGKLTEAEQVERENVRILKQIRSDADVVANGQGYLGQILAAQGRDEEAEPLLVSSYEILSARASGYSVQLPELATTLATLYKKTNRPTEAAEWEKKAAVARATPATPISTKKKGKGK